MISRDGVGGMEPAALQEAESELLYERLAALEMALEAQGWRVLTSEAENEFSRTGLRDITNFARTMAIKNPLIARGVEVKRLYVFGQDFNVTAAQEEIDDLLTTFYDDYRNQAELTSHGAISQKEIELQTDGNLFFVFFVNQVTGRVRVRSICFDEIEDRVANPEDAREPWFYLRRWNVETVDPATGRTVLEPQVAYYPDWRYTPTSRPASLAGVPVLWDRPIFHLRVGGYGNWKFGLSEVYAAIDWALAYKSNLEDWASIVKAYRKFAFQMTTPGGKNALAAAKSKFATSPGGATADGMPPGVASTFIAGPDVNLQPVRTSGATVAADDARRLLLMVASVFGLSETFFGDASVGSLATAKSLDRPTELKMMDRQTLWTAVLAAIHDYVLLWAVKAPQGPLRGLGTVTRTVDEGQIEEHLIWNDGVDPHVAITFPPIVVDDVPALVGAIVQASTLGGQALAGTLDLPTVSQMLLAALGVKDSDEILAELFPGSEVPPSGEVPPSAPPGMAESMMIAAVRELRRAVVGLRG